MIEQQSGESRMEYLARVLYWMMENTCAGAQTADYDGTNCDGMCLAQDIVDELGMDMDT